MDVTPFLAAYGIDAANLTASQKGALGEVLRAGGTAAIQALIRILTAEASQYTPVKTPTVDEQQKAAQAALDAADQAEADRLSRQRTRRWLAGGIGGFVLLLLGLFWLTRKPRPAYAT